MNVFAAAIDALFTDPNLARNAEWRAGSTGKPVTVRIVLRQPVRIGGFGETRLLADTILAQIAGQPMGQCDFGVARAGGGNATVLITRPDGAPRAIYFSNGVAIGADTSEADPGDFSVERESDLNMIRVGDERYEIPDAVALGG